MKACYRLGRMPCSMVICSAAEVAQFRKYLLCACYMPGTVLASRDQSIQSLSRVRLFETPWTAARQASLSFTISRSFLKLMSIESVMPFNHLVLNRPLLLPSIFPSIGVFSNETVLHIRWPKYWSFSISPSSECSGLISFRIDWFDLLAVQGTLKSLLQHRSSKTTYYRFVDIIKIVHPPLSFCVF